MRRWAGLLVSFAAHAALVWLSGHRETADPVDEDVPLEVEVLLEEPFEPQESGTSGTSTSTSTRTTTGTRSGSGSGSDSGSGSGSGSDSGSGPSTGAGSGSGPGPRLRLTEEQAVAAAQKFVRPGLLDGWEAMKIEIPVAQEDKHFVEDDHSLAVGKGSLRLGEGIAFGNGGYGQYDKEKIARMDATRDERRGVMATRDRKNLAAAVARTPARLERIWRDRTSAAEKRVLLFELWDECAEDGPSGVVSAASAVRAALVAFVRRRLPPGSRDAFTDEELRALNRRRTSRARFEPYAAP